MENIIDLSKCHPGQKLLTRNNQIVTFVGNDGVNSNFEFKVILDGTNLYLTRKGKVTTGLMSHDYDVIKIYPLSTSDLPGNRIFEVSYIAQSNCRPSRVKVKDLHNNVTKIFSKDKYEGRDSDDQALNYLLSIGIPITGRAQGKGNLVLLISSDRNTPLK